MVLERRYYIYIMASKSRVLYVGVTGFLMARVLRHKAGEGGAFTRKYRVHRLVYFQSFQNVATHSRGRQRSRSGDGEEGGIDSRGQPDVGGSGSGVGRGSGDEGVRESRFLASLGMTNRGVVSTADRFSRILRRAQKQLRSRVSADRFPNTAVAKAIGNRALPHKSYRAWLGWGAVIQTMSRPRRTHGVRCYNAAHGRRYFDGRSGRIQPVALAARQRPIY